MAPQRGKPMQIIPFRFGGRRRRNPNREPTKFEVMLKECKQDPLSAPRIVVKFTRTEAGLLWEKMKEKKVVPSALTKWLEKEEHTDSDEEGEAKIPEKMEVVKDVESSTVVDRTEFIAASIVLVMINIVTIGLQTDMDPSSGWPEFWALVNNGFLLMYLGEFIFKLLSNGSKILSQKLSMMDFCIIFLCFLGQERARALPAVRLLHIFRLAQRTKALGSSKEQRALVYSAKQNFFTLIWMTAIFFLLTACCAILARKAIGDSAEWAGTTDPFVYFKPFQSFDRYVYFGDITKSFFTMLQVATASRSFERISRPVTNVYPVMALFFFAFILLTTFCLLVVNIAIMVQGALTSATIQNAMAMDTKREERMILGRKVLRLLTLVDFNNDGELSAEEIDLAFVQYPQFTAMLTDLGVPVTDGFSLVRMLDKSGDGLISYEELQNGITEMDEELVSKDYVKLSMRLWSLLKRAELLGERLEYIRQQLEEATRKIRGAILAVEKWNNHKETSEMIRHAKDFLRQQLPEPPLKLSADLRAKLDGPKEEDRGDEVSVMLSFADRYLGDVVGGPSHARRKQYEEAHNGQPLRAGLPGGALEPGRVLEGTTAEASEKIRRQTERAAAARLTAPTRRKSRLPDPPGTWEEQRQAALETAKQDEDPLSMPHPLDNVSSMKLKWVRDFF
eukprot:TRINITY_DN102255_c0_g1_i1.p1 TRINITY_DN102255_c0_g1~~TRINITY_DN102255_c0_g1_i1.p1  ORF type:complete len:713 (-),score=147.40 TRINITY_DN102255_c0_g1_i1:34-2061(-)